jgi:hypothetical protein
MARIDLLAYDGPTQRADGRRPYNGYLSPMEGDWYWANRLLDRRISSRFEFSIVALSDGRWSVSGLVSDIETGSRVFPTREAALRSSVATFIRMVRNARRWPGYDHLSEEAAQRLILWALDIAGEPPAILKPIAVKVQRTGLPLLDFMRGS